MGVRRGSPALLPTNARPAGRPLASPHLPFDFNARCDRAERASLHPLERKGALVSPLAAVCLSGCDIHGAPSYVLFGAYFPEWMFLALLAVLVALIARVVFVATGLARVLPFQLFVCASIGISAALFTWSRWLES